MKTVTRLLTRLCPPLAACAVGGILPLLCFRLGVAHAAAHLGLAADPTATPPPAGVDWTFWIAVVSAAGTAASLLLHVIAPRTKTTVDDRLRDDLDEVLTWWRNRPSATVAPPSGGNTAAMLAVLLLGALAAPALTACHTAPVQDVKSEGTAAGHAVLDCVKRLGPGQLEVGLALLAAEAVQRATAGTKMDAAALAAAAILDVTEVKTCALAEYHAVTAAQKASSPGTAVQGLATPDPVADAVARVKTARGVTSIVTPGGSV